MTSKTAELRNLDGPLRRDDSPTAREPDPSVLFEVLEHLPGMAYRCRRDRVLIRVGSGSPGVLGEAPEELAGAGRSLTEWVHPEDRDRVEKEIENGLRSAGSFQTTYRMLTADGNVRRVQEIGRETAGDEEVLLVGTVIPLDPAAEAADGTPSLPSSLSTGRPDDRHPVTGLPGRSFLMERLGSLMRRVRRRPDRSFALLSVRLDRFELILESLGHDAANQVLQLAARRIITCLRQEDVIAHPGGDHFVILLDDIDEVSNAVRVAQRVNELLGLPLYLDDEEIFTSASIGIALGLSGYDSPEHPLRDADIAMARARAAGGGRNQLFDRAMHRRAVARLRLETELRHALQREEFSLVYQPIVNLIDGGLRGFEALIRWDHPRRGRLLPARFLPTAVDAGLIIPITWWVLSEACRQLRHWQMLFPEHRSLFMSINLTGKQFAHTDLVQRIESSLVENGLAPANLRIEITEDVLVDMAESVGQTLSGLDELGIHLALDDFGTGYSSLAALRRLPLKSFKIDRSFVGGVEIENGSYRGLEIVRTIVNLARDLGLDVVAEGVESTEQKHFLLSLGCRLGQGYLFARPQTPEAICELLREESEMTTIDPGEAVSLEQAGRGRRSA